MLMKNGSDVLASTSARWMPDEPPAAADAVADAAADDAGAAADELAEELAEEPEELQAAAVAMAATATSEMSGLR
jgi:hypothetical protein